MLCLRATTLCLPLPPFLPRLPTHATGPSPCYHTQHGLDGSLGQFLTLKRLLWLFERHLSTCWINVSHIFGRHLRIFEAFVSSFFEEEQTTLPTCWSGRPAMVFCHLTRGISTYRLQRSCGLSRRDVAAVFAPPLRADAPLPRRLPPPSQHHCASLLRAALLSTARSLAHLHTLVLAFSAIPYVLPYTLLFARHSPLQQRPALLTHSFRIVFALSYCWLMVCVAICIPPLWFPQPRAAYQPSSRLTGAWRMTRRRCTLWAGCRALKAATYHRLRAHVRCTYTPLFCCGAAYLSPAACAYTYLSRATYLNTRHLSRRRV